MAEERRTAQDAPGILGIDPAAMLVKDPGLLIDPTFLGSLHRELRAELGPREAGPALVQMGLLHGLKDALRTIDESFDAGVRPAGLGFAPPLAIRFGGAPALAPGRIELGGLWPECTEAAAHVAALGRASDPSCFLSAGYTSGWLSGILDADILVLEASCAACGAENCCFTARETRAWQDGRDPRAEALLAALPYDAFRDFARSGLAGAVPPPQAGEAAGGVVHIWGPVMVVPYQDEEEALRAVDLIGRDPAAREVSVVVVDLGGIALGDRRAAAGLERVVELIEAWGAETVFSDVTPQAEPAVQALSRQPLFVQRSLSEAIATAFQIAEAQQSTA